MHNSIKYSRTDGSKNITRITKKLILKAGQNRAEREFNSL